MEHYNPINISSLEELKLYEHEIVQRINQFPNGGKLLLADPSRLLQEVNVYLTDEAVQKWNALSGGAFNKKADDETYSYILTSKPGHDKITIKVHHLLQEKYPSNPKPERNEYT